MVSKVHFYSLMAEQAAKQITGSFQQWTSFLSTASRLYKYPYPDQLMIHIQRPDATACAEYELWSDTMGRYVKRGAKGIALLDCRGEQPRLRYVFDLQQAKREVSNRSIMIKTSSGYQLTRLSDILFIERCNRKNRIVTTDGQEISLLGYTMNQLEDMLEGCGFYRCYQSFIVNLSQVVAVRADNEAKNYAIRFKEYEGEILLSREKYAELVALLKGRYAGINI